MTDSLVTPGVPEPLEERLAGVLPRLEAHLARHARRVPGVEPEDVAQEVVVRALRYRASYDERRALWPWLRSVAEHVLHDHRASIHSTTRTSPLTSRPSPTPSARRADS